MSLDQKWVERFKSQEWGGRGWTLVAIWANCVTLYEKRETEELWSENLKKDGVTIRIKDTNAEINDLMRT